MLGLTRRCWCGYHEVGRMSSMEVIAHNKFVRETIDWYNRPIGVYAYVNVSPLATGVLPTTPTPGGYELLPLADEVQA